MILSSRVQNLRASSTVAVTSTAKALKASGKDVLSFAAGEPDFDTPPRIKDAAVKALTQGRTGYAPPPGDPDTRAAIADKLASENRITGLTPDHVVISPGGKQSLYLIFQSLIDPQPASRKPLEVVIPTPAWVSYRPQAELAGAKVVEVPAGPERHFKITPDQLRKALTERTRVFLFNSPSNPCGVMYSPDEIADLVAVLDEAARTICPDLVIVTDEIYEKLIYGDAAHLSMGSIPSIAERTVTVNGFSKAFAMTGWRLGYLACPGDFGLSLAKACTKLQGQINTAVTTFTLPAAVVALKECADDVERMRQAFAARGALIHQRIDAMPGVKCPTPTGAFYVFPDVSAHLGKASAAGTKLNNVVDFAQALLQEHLVACVPGCDFGGCGDQCVRFSFACSEEQIAAGMDRLGEFLSSLR